MKKLKQDLLFVLADGVRFLDGGDDYGYMSYNQLYWRLNDYKGVSVRGAVGDLIKRGLLGKLVKGKRVWVSLTNLGRDRLVSMFPISRMKQRKWDLKWRLIIIDRGKLVLKKQRKLLQKIKRLGYVMLARGVYVSPFAVSEESKKVLMDPDFLGSVRMMETKRFIVGDDKSFVSSIWRVNTIYNKYSELSTQAERVLYRVRRAKGLTHQSKTDYRALLFAWKRLVTRDPGLPLKLTSVDFGREKLQKLLEKTGKSVRELEKKIGSE